MLVDQVYAGIVETANHTNPERGILGGTNEVIDEMNHKVLNGLSDEVVVPLSADSVDENRKADGAPHRVRQDRLQGVHRMTVGVHG